MVFVAACKIFLLTPPKGCSYNPPLIRTHEVWLS